MNARSRNATVAYGDRPLVYPEADQPMGDWRDCCAASGDISPKCNWALGATIRRSDNPAPRTLYGREMSRRNGDRTWIAMKPLKC